MPIIAIPLCDKLRDYEEAIRRVGAITGLIASGQRFEPGPIMLR